MFLYHLLKITLSAISILGISMMMLGRQEIGLPTLAILAVLVSIVLTDILGWIRLNRPMANFAALIAVAISLIDFFQNGSISGLRRDYQLVAITNLLIYLQVILLYQEKLNRVCWQLITLSLLQVLVSAALNDSIFYGLLLLLYMIFGMIALHLMSCYDSLIDISPNDENPEHFEHTPSHRKHRSFFSKLVGNRTNTPSTKIYLKHLLFSAIKMSIATVLIASVLFVLFPRWSGGIRIPLNQGPTIGLSDDVVLSSNAQFVSENSDVVIELELNNARTGEEYIVADGLWIRSTTAFKYEAGKWTGRSPKKTPKQNKFEYGNHEINPQTAAADVVIQKLNIYDKVSKNCRIHPVVKIAPKGSNYSHYQQLFKASNYENTYFTDGFSNNIQNRLIPLRSHSRKRYLDKNRRKYLLISDTNTKALVKLEVEKMIAASNNKNPTVFEKINLFEQHLSNSGKFTYSLDLPQRDKGLDPVVDFLTKHRVGHCEYFASAMAIMCRTQNIPSRLVIGYRTSPENQWKNFYQIKNLNAHSWVEVYLEENQIPKSLRISEESYKYGAWLRVDPTPSEAEDSLAAQTGLLADLQRQLDRMNLLWRIYMVNFNNRLQKKLVYDPLKDQTAIAFQKVNQNHWLTNASNDFLGLFGLTFESSSEQWFSWRGILLVISLSTLACSAIYLIYSTYGPLKFRLNQFYLRRKRKLSRPRDTGFYGQFEDLLERQGMSRCVGQTPYEFCLTVSGQLAEKQNLKKVSSIPKTVVSLFYRVRYGCRPLSETEQHQVEQELQTLNQALKSDSI